MAGAASVLSDSSRLSRIDRSLYRIERILALLSGLAVFGLMFLAVFSVGGRNFFNQPLPGYVDWIEQAMPLIAVMGISYVQRDGGHIRMDIVVGVLKGRTLYVVEFLTTLAVLVLMALLVWGSWAHFGRSFDWGAPLWSRDSSMDIALPLWPAKLLVPVAFAVMCLRLVLQLWGYARAFIYGLSQPIGVPLVLDAAAVAAHEAEHVGGFGDTNDSDERGA
ncbi:TRAP-type C4-dicarboxylate transport system permease small subunit [Roseovarius halotolerans]|uniref:TRAP transporter small permease protein n=1 Tax=Roseovarius halotolerans TaxID=505353 RepID=A0A1X6Y575_9RHOB|nr:TRAP transporter small permease [Roseovarius halotolerans]RKT35341.1 TRAP-type C4-dicarboxylate transport system permease small subunit [Roseovarius halotolerans]SLN10594.1 Tripartite ATP-independent periplasmic transporters, DctQ component [Roseovarius halotolerans]